MSWNVPAHVPQELVVDIDVFDVPGGDLDPSTCWRIFQKEGQHLAWCPSYGGHWVATCGEDLPHLYRDWQHLSNSKVVIPDPGNIMLPIQSDPPAHRGFRGIIDPFFTKDAVDAREEEIRALTVDLIEGFRPNGECEFVSEFGLRLPLMIFMNMVGLPMEHLPMLRELVDTFSSNPDVNKKIEANAAMEDYLQDAIEQRVKESRKDGISRMIGADVGGRPVTVEELRSTCRMLLQGGLDTVSNHLGFVALHLARHPEQRDYIRSHPEQMPVIVNELLRRFPVANMSREIAQDFDYKGVLLKKGDRIMLPVSLYNLDAAKFSNPDEVDFTRDTKHITFGSGPHTCSGAILARKEITIFLQEWLSRIPDFEADETRPPKMVGMAANSIYSLWLKWPVEEVKA